MPTKRTRAAAAKSPGTRLLTPLQLVSQRMQSSTLQRRAHQRRAGNVLVHLLSRYTTDLNEPPTGQPRHQIRVVAYSKRSTEADQDEACSGRGHLCNACGIVVSPTGRDHVVAATVHQQREICADVQVGQSCDITVYEPDRQCLVCGLIYSYGKGAGSHLDTDRLPSVPGQIDGIAACAAAEVKGTSPGQPVLPLDKLCKAMIGNVGGVGSKMQAIAEVTRAAKECGQHIANCPRAG